MSQPAILCLSDTANPNTGEEDPQSLQTPALKQRWDCQAPLSLSALWRASLCALALCFSLPLIKAFPPADPVCCVLESSCCYCLGSRSLLPFNFLTDRKQRLSRHLDGNRKWSGITAIALRWYDFCSIFIGLAMAVTNFLT